MEESLDIEWAHVMAPMANIILFEAPTTPTTEHLYTAVQTAANTPGVVDRLDELERRRIVSASQTTYDSTTFTTPSGTSAVPPRSAAPACRAA